ncbi:MAG: FxsA family protein [Nitriliruptoraceae bacterium]
MPALLVILFVAVPIIELLLVIEVGSAIGAGWTVALLIADSVLGAWLLRREGARAWRQFRDALAAGRWPGDEVAHGALVLVGGTLLLTPGFLTDVVGFVLLLRGGRRLVLAIARPRLVASRWARWAARSASGATGSDAAQRRSQTGGDVLDIEVVEIERESRDDDTRD